MIQENFALPPQKKGPKEIICDKVFILYPQHTQINYQVIAMQNCNYSKKNMKKLITILYTLFCLKTCSSDNFQGRVLLTFVSFCSRMSAL